MTAFGEGAFWTVIGLLVAGMVFCLGGLVGSSGRPPAMEKEAIRYGCAQYAPETGEFEWKNAP